VICCCCVVPPPRHWHRMASGALRLKLSGVRSFRTSLSCKACPELMLLCAMQDRHDQCYNGVPACLGNLALHNLACIASCSRSLLLDGGFVLWRMMRHHDCDVINSRHGVAMIRDVAATQYSSVAPAVCMDGDAVLSTIFCAQIICDNEFRSKTALVRFTGHRACLGAIPQYYHTAAYWLREPIMNFTGGLVVWLQASKLWV
jgi:hypothetical protein